MKIALVSEHASPLATLRGADAGGQSVHVAALANSLAERGHDVVVYTRRADTRQPDQVTMASGVVVDHVPAGPPESLPKDELLPYMPSFAAHLARHWKTDRPHIVHAHHWMSGLAALGATRHVKVPIVQSYHALATTDQRWQKGDDTSPPERYAIEEEIGRRANVIIANCTQEARELQTMRVPVRNVCVVPRGVDLKVFRPSRRRPAGAGTRPRLLSLGRTMPHKGVETIIQALREVPQAELVIAGGNMKDPEVVRLRKLAATLELDDRVKMVGKVSRKNVPALVSSATVLVTVPWYESFGMVPLEAMASGVPVVASAVGGHLDTVTGAGILVRPRHPRTLARVLNGLLESEQLRRDLASAGVKRVRAKYGWPQVAAQTERIYRRAIAGRDPISTTVGR
ncbi:glycosyltransferase [Sinosporangium siamense]|uniref:Glycosyl transferase n=1 Tax=Sinosporangium siamense TaxID=1367973 RepID=A0A919VEL8_9ACTN|nr:glycosyltransferase [Sinosporangium siamense]GII95254.1 glycosyl transferase [Sinosporangium siamense]